MAEGLGGPGTALQERLHPPGPKRAQGTEFRSLLPAAESPPAGRQQEDTWVSRANPGCAPGSPTGSRGHSAVRAVGFTCRVASSEPAFLCSVPRGSAPNRRQVHTTFTHSQRFSLSSFYFKLK